MFYKMTRSAEESDFAYIEMTEAEAKVVDRVLTELHLKTSGWCGSCYIDLDSPQPTELAYLQNLED